MRCLMLLSALALVSCAAAPDVPAAPREITRPAQAPTQDPAKPNIVLIFVDDLGYGELGCYGQTKIDTPNIDALARDGLRFTQFYTAAPVCAPARSALFTGQHLGHTPNRDNSEVEPEGQGPLPAGTRTVAHDLKSAGYTTACIGKWGLGFVGSTGDPNLMGFDLFFGYNCQRQAHNYYPTHLWRNAERIALEGNNPKTRAEAIYAGDLMLAAAKDFIASSHAKPFFLAYTTPLPHLALQPPAFNLRRYQGLFDENPYVGGKGYLPHESPRAAYAAMITRLDDEVGEIRAALEKAGVAENTMIVFTSDNGPTHDVGGVDTGYFNSTAGLRGRKGSVWEGGIRVPGIACWPGRIPAGKTTDVPAWSVDLRATFDTLAGVTATASDGCDISPLLLEGRAPTREFFYWPFPGYGGQEAVREGHWKLVRVGMNAAAKNGAPRPAWQLYDLANEPKETRDVSASHPSVVARLAAMAAREYIPSERYPLGDLDRTAQ